MKVNIYEAKAQLSKLIEKAMNGENVVIAKAGRPIVDLVPHQDSRSLPARKPGGYEVNMKAFSEADETITAMFESL